MVSGEFAFHAGKSVAAAELMVVHGLGIDRMVPLLGY